MYFLCFWCSINIRVHGYLPNQIKPQQNSKEKISSKNAKEEFEAFSTWNNSKKYLKWIIRHIPAKLSLFRKFEGRNIKIFWYSFLLSSGKWRKIFSDPHSNHLIFMLRVVEMITATSSLRNHHRNDWAQHIAQSKSDSSSSFKAAIKPWFRCTGEFLSHLST